MQAQDLEGDGSGQPDINLNIVAAPDSVQVRRAGVETVCWASVNHLLWWRQAAGGCAQSGRASACLLPGRGYYQMMSELRRQQACRG